MIEMDVVNVVSSIRENASKESSKLYKHWMKPRWDKIHKMSKEIYTDFTNYLDDYFTVVKRGVGMFIEDKIQPRIDLFQASSIELYDTHLNSVVAEYFIPAYNRHISPTAAFMKAKITPTLKEIWMQSFDAFESVRLTAVSGIEEITRAGIIWDAERTKKHIENQKKDIKPNKMHTKDRFVNVPRWFINSLKYARSNAAELVHIFFSIFAGCLILIFLKQLMNLMIRIITSPVKVCWFLCPMRVLVRKNARC
mmetsp:Transcript_38837/g.45251  ORF Transcript_38837/g.45251 Transcript_38837/m.45251 type:complete len:252 (+) Transcript_38837:419-1174(+)